MLGSIDSPKNLNEFALGMEVRGVDFRRQVDPALSILVREDEAEAIILHPLFFGVFGVEQFVGEGSEGRA